MKKVHLGCGNNIIPDWINIDMINHPDIMYFDLRNKLPFDNNSVDFFFCEHFLEHLARSEGYQLLLDINRCLKVGGVSRVVVPSLDYLVQNYINNNLGAYNAVYWYPQTKCELLNGGMREWEHKHMYDEEDLLKIHYQTNFTQCTIEAHRFSKYPELNNIGIRPYTGEISIDAVK